jgi:hypothetical protein
LAHWRGRSGGHACFSASDGEPTGRANARPMTGSAIRNCSGRRRWVSRRAQPILRSVACAAACPTGKSPDQRANHLTNCPAPFAKIFCFALYPNQQYIPHRPVPQRGGSRSSRTRGGMRWTLMVRQTSRAGCGRRSRVVLTPRRWCQVGGGNSACDGVNKPITGESTYKP